MELRITIPHEFESHFKNDRFKDSLGRILFDVKSREKIKLSGLYEWELIDMLEIAFKNAEVLKGEQNEN